MRLEDLTGDDRTLVVAALQALYRERANSIIRPFSPASSQARNHQMKPFLAWRKVFWQFAGLALFRRDET